VLLEFSPLPGTVHRMRRTRPYLQGDYEADRTSLLIWLLSALIGGFVLQLVFGSKLLGGFGGGLEGLLALSGDAVRRGWIWTLLSHGLLHSTSFLFHLVINAVALLFLGRALAPMLGSLRFLGVLAVATIVGGLAWLPLHWNGGELVGINAGTYAILVVFARFNPRQPLQFLVLFLFPVTLRPLHLVWLLAGFDLMALLAFEVPGRPAPFGWSVAGSAHLAGMAVGYSYHRFVHHAAWFNPADRAEAARLRWWGQSPVGTPAVPSPAADLRGEVDRILDKISSSGLESLTPGEREVLARARRELSRP
jgi:membrane associated rhomboid family serine protease